MVTNGDFDKVVAEAKNQGWEVKPTADGYTFLAPDGKTSIPIHRLHRSSGPYALKAHVRRMRQLGGFRWPPQTGSGK